MNYQDWTPVTVRRHFSKKELVRNGMTTSQVRDPAKNEKIRMAKLENAEGPGPKKRVNPESIQALVRKRIELKFTQEKADNLCAFPRNTFRDIESNRLVPNEEQKRRIQHNFNIQIRIDTSTT